MGALVLVAWDGTCVCVVPCRLSSTIVVTSAIIADSIWSTPKDTIPIYSSFRKRHLMPVPGSFELRAVL